MPLTADRDGAASVTLRAGDGGTATVHTHGAHVTSWRTPDGREQLYLSPRAVIDDRAAIRGGVPVIFPQFAGEGPLPKHGFARTAAWRVIDAAPDGSDPYVVLRLADDASTRAVWPFPFVATYRVELVEGSLRLSLSVHNPGDRQLPFTAALHTYLRVADAAAVRVRGLQGARYRDSARGNVQEVQADPELAIAGEVNRIYFDVAGIVGIVEGDREVRSAMRGFSDVVVWNPGQGGEAALGDMEPGGSARMLCIEAAAIGTPVRIEPGQSWTGVQRLTAGRGEPVV